MNDEDVKQFINAFEDFMKHAEENIDSHQRWEEARQYVQDGHHRMNFLEKKAAELEITVDYYMQEFM